MFTIAKGMLEGAWALIAGWVLPSAITLLLFWVLVLPDVDHETVEDALSGLVEGEGAVVLVAAVVLGWLLSVLATPLYRVLEGYPAWPPALKQRLIARQRRLRKRLRDEARSAREDGGIDCARAYVRLRRYPADPAQVLPTRFGNAIRAFECYGQERYRLDTVLLWPHLTSAAPGPIKKEVGDARTEVDFFVCLFYVQGLLGASAVLAMVLSARVTPSLLAAAVTGFAVAALSYRAAVAATDGWGDAVRALVELGRLPLAEAWGLSRPERLEDEKRMWQEVAWWVGYPYQENVAHLLDEFRADGPPQPEAAPGSSDSLTEGRGGA